MKQSASVTATRLPARVATVLLLALLLVGCSSGGGAASSPPAATPTATGATAADPTVVTIGDSIMKGHGLDADQAWPALMASQDGWRLHNLACDGAGFLTMGDDQDCGETFSGLVKKAVALHPRTIIIEGSSNDVGQSDDELLPETVAQLAQLRAALPDAQIIGLSTIWGDTSVPAQLASIDTEVQTAVTKVGGRFLEIGQPLRGHPEWMQSDDVHPTAAGQLAIFGAVQTAFREAGIRA